MDAARQQRLEIEHGEHPLEAHIGRTPRAPLCIPQVRGDVEVRKQSSILEYVADAAPFRRDCDLPPGIEKDVVIQTDLAAIGHAEALR